MKIKMTTYLCFLVGQGGGGGGGGFNTDHSPLTHKINTHPQFDMKNNDTIIIQNYVKTSTSKILPLSYQQKCKNIVL